MRGQKDSAEPPEGLASLAEKGLQQGTALGGQDAGEDFAPVVQRGMSQQIVNAPGHAGLGVPCAEHHPIDLGKDDRPGALGAGLKRDVQGTARKPVRSGRSERLAKCQSFRMSSGVMTMFDLIVRPGKHYPITNDHGADRHFARVPPQQRLGNREAHAGDVLGRHRQVRPLRGCA